MNLENELLEKFQVEELEKRYEFSVWTPTEATIEPVILKQPDPSDPFDGPNQSAYGVGITIGFGG